jgi:hypothetical protein
MIVTGVQAVGAKGVSTVQVAATDTRNDPRVTAAPADRERPGSARSGDAQPVVFPRSGVPLDQRPVALRREHAILRYRADGGARERSGHEAGAGRDDGAAANPNR